MSKNKNKVERRTTSKGVRMEGSDGKKIRGYAAVFGDITHIYGDVYEVIDKGFFSEVLEQDVRVLVNHKDDNLLARTAAKTATIDVDDKGLWYECDPVKNHFGKGVLESIKRGDMNQSSFGFQWENYPDGYDYEYLDDGKVLRRLKKCKTLFDVGPVTFPAYETTEAGVRSLNEFRSKTKEEGTEEEKKTDPKDDQKREPTNAEKYFARSVQILNETL